MASSSKCRLLSPWGRLGLRYKRNLYWMRLKKEMLKSVWDSDPAVHKFRRYRNWNKRPADSRSRFWGLPMCLIILTHWISGNCSDLLSGCRKDLHLPRGVFQRWFPLHSPRLPTCLKLQSIWSCWTYSKPQRLQQHLFCPQFQYYWICCYNSQCHYCSYW